MPGQNRRIGRSTIALVTVAVAAGSPPAAAQAATSATGSQSVTADVNNTLEATFPGAYAWGSLDAGATGNTSSAQTVNVKSNSSWGVKASTDQVGGHMKEWTGAAYVASSPRTLANALTWRLSALGGAGQPTSFAAFTSTPALVTGSQAVTDDAGVDVALTYKQAISYADVNAGANDYRALVSFDVAQGY
jgi:hypothetical protein